ncbi:MAG TPA: alkaline phosphatase family protein [Stellaceae bacterium]|nr:alkaline phosphatase family protein [Stellaceae bacterium]
MASPLDLIDTVVVVILENRSFDHMLGYLSLAGPEPIPVDGLHGDPEWLQRHANSGVAPFAFSVERIDDPPHDAAAVAVQLGAPAAPFPMNGFVESYRRRRPPPADERLVMGYYTGAAVPVFDFFARNFTVCDHWFAALPTGTQANRLMAMSGTTCLIDNAPLFLPDQPLVYDWLSERGVSWCVYQSGDFLPFFALMPRWQGEIAASLALDALVPHAHPRFRRYRNFARDWTTEQNMPAVIFIEPEYTDAPHVAPNDDHPPTGITPGQVLLRDIYTALIANPVRWARTVMIVTYDEHGGFFDHVPPLPIPMRIPGHGPNPVFLVGGVRVPAFIVSPLVDPATIYPEPLDHTAVLQFLADKFAGGIYSAAVGERQAFLSPLTAAITRTAPRSAAPEPPEVGAIEMVAATVPERSASAEANAAAFRLAAAKIATDHPGIAIGWPGLLQAAAGRLRA